METVTIHKNKLIIGGSIVATLVIGILIGLAFGSHDDWREGGRHMMDRDDASYMMGGNRPGGPQGGMMRPHDYQGGTTGNAVIDASGTVIVPNTQ